VSHPVERGTGPLAQAPERATITVGQVTAPVTQGVAPVAGELTPVGGLITRAGGEGTQPAMTMLSPLSWDEHPE